jgi:hypothetical protein
VQLRYAESGADAQWKTMIYGRITNMSFAFPSGGGSTVTLEGEDLASLLKQCPDDNQRFNHIDEVDAARRLLAAAPLSDALPLAAPTGAPRARFSAPLPALVFQKSSTYLQSLQALADRLDYEIFVDNDVLKGHELHFEPARSLWSVQGGAPREKATIQVVALEWGRDIIDFTPRLVVWEQYTGLRIRAAHPVRPSQRISESIGELELMEEVGLAPEPAPNQLNAVQVRRRFFNQGGERDNEPDRSCSGLDGERARLKVAAELRNKARELVTAELSTVGRPELRPGMFVSIERMREPFQGLYYVTKAVHTVDGSGYRTQLSLRRPFLYLPHQETRR